MVISTAHQDIDTEHDSVRPKGLEVMQGCISGPIPYHIAQHQGKRGQRMVRKRGANLFDSERIGASTVSPPSSVHKHSSIATASVQSIQVLKNYL